MGSRNLVSECCERLQLKNDSVYFNSGIILFDLVAIREYWTRQEFVNQMNSIHSEKLIYPDQDMLKLIFKKIN